MRELSITTSPKLASSRNEIKRIIAKELELARDEKITFRIVKKSIDARNSKIKVNLKLQVVTGEEKLDDNYSKHIFPNVSQSPKVYIIGAGPAGLFAAMKLVKLGLCPVVIERGKAVDERKGSLANLHRDKLLDLDSNYCFGEGGAGTFSDGKLYTRSKKRGNIESILELFHQHGAQDEILYEAHPHIGTNVLPKIIKNIRETILKSGGEIVFNEKLKEINIKDNKVVSFSCESGLVVETENLILATGHSAHDIYRMLDKQNVELELKSFAMGVRLEHPQNLIDQIQYHNPKGRNKYLPAATYSFLTRVRDRGVYSFCMCPGGVIVPASTNYKQQVVNGMSSSERNTQFANSGIAVEIYPSDLGSYSKYGALAGLEFQADFERMAYEKAGGDFKAPAQRMLDFVNSQTSENLPACSYQPEIVSSDMHNWMPSIISKSLQLAFKNFAKKSNKFLTNEAVIVGVESRTSSPVRIPRNRETYQHIKIEGLYPCGEGAGYAGGIVSAAMDGENCAIAIADRINKAN
ncbi:MAG: FAD-binding protein [Marinifilaceae bacterium]|jgi:uncharacterized FAD-dependent dehydrogenase|nr:FAD-binding protein [Marinifilaceae bacterium]